MSSCTVLLVSFYAAGTAPAAPAPSAGPGTACGAARVRTRLADAVGTPLSLALSVSASRTHTCWKSKGVIVVKAISSIRWIRFQRNVLLFGFKARDKQMASYVEVVKPHGDRSKSKLILSIYKKNHF